MSKPFNVTDAHRVAYLFLYFATETDQQLASEEMIIISEKIDNYLNNKMNENQKLNSWDIVTESLNWFNSLSVKDKDIVYHQLMAYLSDNFATDQKSCFLEDLKVLAHSDGVFLEAEKVLIDKSAELLN